MRLADGTDGLNQIAATRLALAEVFAHCGAVRVKRSRQLRKAIELFERKGNSVGASQAGDCWARDSGIGSEEAQRSGPPSVSSI